MEKITFTLKEKQYTVKNEKELAMFFQLLDSDNKTVSAVLHWETIMHLDERLLTLITSYRGLISCMKSMNDKNRFLFLIKIGDILGKIITSSEELARILSEIPEEQDKIKLVKQFRRKGLEGIIHSADDLARILEWIYDEGEITVLEMLDYDFFLSLLTKPDDIYKVLNYCSDATKTFIIERIGLLRLKSLVYSAHDFFILLK